MKKNKELSWVGRISEKFTRKYRKHELSEKSGKKKGEGA